MGRRFNRGELRQEPWLSTIYHEVRGAILGLSYHEMTQFRPNCVWGAL